jgi:hypothetical protein
LDLIEDERELERLHAEGIIPAVMLQHLKEDLEHRKESGRAAKFYKRLFWYVGVPTMLLVGWNAYRLEMEHLRHLEEHPLEFVPYPHLRILNKVSAPL